MDTGSKSLAQLSEEGKEGKFVTLEVGSKLSGYTKDYLERLCRLNKIQYRLWSNGVFVVELESLLKETHTILLSYEGITFVDKSELTDPIPQQVGNILSSALREVNIIAAASEGDAFLKNNENASITRGSTQQIPHFGEANRIGGGVSGDHTLSFVGKSVVSDATKSGVVEVNTVHIPLAITGEKDASNTRDLPPKNSVHTPVHIPLSITKEDGGTSASPRAIPIPPHTPVHVPVMPLDMHAEKTEQPTPLGVPLPVGSVPHADTPALLSIPPKETSDPHLSVADTSDEKPIEAMKLTVAHLSLPHAPADPDTVKTVHDGWDHMLLGGDVQSKVEMPVLSPGAVAPLDLSLSSTVTSEQESNTVAVTDLSSSPYHPIATSIDPEIHRDDAPLFPLLSKERASMRVTIPPVVRHSDTPFTPPTGQKVVVFRPEEYPGYGHAPDHASEPPVTTVASSDPVQNPRSVPVSAVNDSETPSINASDLPRSAGSSKVPAMRVMPGVPMVLEDDLPMIAPEHHLAIPPQHELSRSTGFNAAFAVVIGVSFMFFAGGLLTGTITLPGENISYVAGVGAALDVDGVRDQALYPDRGATSTMMILPFSNEVMVTNGSKPGSVIIQPIFPGGAGQAYQYSIVPLNDVE